MAWTFVHGVGALVSSGKDAGTAATGAKLMRRIMWIIAMDRSVYQARWLLAPVFAIGLSTAVLAALSG
jgi:hypothetical protein